MHRTVEVNGIKMHIAEKGQGPLVLFLHGFPELWYSWRHQILALSSLGYHAVAPDLRGYGDTDCPDSISSYTVFHLVGNVIALIDFLSAVQIPFSLLHRGSTKVPSQLSTPTCHASLQESHEAQKPSSTRRRHCSPDLPAVHWHQRHHVLCTSPLQHTWIQERRFPLLRRDHRRRQCPLNSSIHLLRRQGRPSHAPPRGRGPNDPLPRASLCSHSNSTAPDVSMLDYEVAELTWENGQVSMHGLGLPRVPAKPATTAAGANPRSTASTSPSKYAWDKPRASGTLESIVNQATRLPHRGKSMFDLVCGGGCNGDDLVPWFEPHRVATAAAAAAAASNNMTVDALMPCANHKDEQTTHVMDSMPATGYGTCMVGCSTGVGSCSGPAAIDEAALLASKRARVARVPTAREWNSRDQSASGSATSGRDNQLVALDTCDRELGMDYTSTSMGSPENTSSDGRRKITVSTISLNWLYISIFDFTFLFRVINKLFDCIIN